MYSGERTGSTWVKASYLGCIAARGLEALKYRAPRLTLALTCHPLSPLACAPWLSIALDDALRLEMPLALDLKLLLAHVLL